MLPFHRVFVTGGNGFIGSRVVRLLRQHGVEVHCLLRPASRRRRIEDVPHHEHPGDVRDVDSVRRGLHRSDAVIHLAGIAAWSDIHSPKMREVVVDGTRNVLDAARSAGVARMVFVSSAAAVASSSTPQIFDETAPFNLDPRRFLYSAAKRDAEVLCTRATRDGLPVVIVNPGEVYGADDDDLITASYIRETLTTFPAMAVTGGTSVTHVDDVAAAIVSALTNGRPGERYILGGENLTVREIVELTLATAGVARRVIQPPNWLTRGVVSLQVATRLTPFVPPGLLDYATRFWWMDSSKAIRELAYTFRPGRGAIGDVVDWLRRTGRA